MNWLITFNNDTGTLLLSSNDNHRGRYILIDGESNNRKVSYVMPGRSGTRIATKGFGPFPLGKVHYKWQDSIVLNGQEDAILFEQETPAKKYCSKCGRLVHEGSCAKLVNKVSDTRRPLLELFRSWGIKIENNTASAETAINELYSKVYPSFGGTRKEFVNYLIKGAQHGYLKKNTNSSGSLDELLIKLFSQSTDTHDQVDGNTETDIIMSNKNTSHHIQESGSINKHVKSAGSIDKSGKEKPKEGNATTLKSFKELGNYWKKNM